MICFVTVTGCCACVWWITTACCCCCKVFKRGELIVAADNVVACEEDKFDGNAGILTNNCFDTGGGCRWCITGFATVECVGC